MRKLVVVIGIVVVVCAVAVPTATAGQLSKPTSGAVSEIGPAGSGILSASGGGRSAQTCSGLVVREVVDTEGNGEVLAYYLDFIGEDCGVLTGICEAVLCPQAEALADQTCKTRKNVCDGTCTVGNEVLTPVAEGVCLVQCYGASYDGTCSKMTGPASDPQ